MTRAVNEAWEAVARAVEDGVGIGQALADLRRAVDTEMEKLDRFDVAMRAIHGKDIDAAIAEYEASAEKESIEGLRAYYVCQGVNWGLTLWERDKAQADRKELREALIDLVLDGGEHELGCGEGTDCACYLAEVRSLVERTR